MELNIGDYIETYDREGDDEEFFVAGVIGHITNDYIYVLQNDHDGSHPRDDIGMDMRGYKYSWCISRDSGYVIEKKPLRTISFKMLLKNI